MSKALMKLIDEAQLLGLPSADVKFAKELLDNKEYGLCFDTIVTQLYERSIPVNNQFYLLLEAAAKKMDIPKEEYSFIVELISK